MAAYGENLMVTDSLAVRSCLRTWADGAGRREILSLTQGLSERTIAKTYPRGKRHEDPQPMTKTRDRAPEDRTTGALERTSPLRRASILPLARRGSANCMMDVGQWRLNVESLFPSC
jgi:hypothetical protein